MTTILKRACRLANRVARPLGIELVVRPPHSPQKPKPPEWSIYEAALHGLLSAKQSINIMQVGANDGKWNDPIHSFVQQHSGQTHLLLCEPQPEIAQILSDTYSDHCDVRIFAGAVSKSSGNLVLYRVKPELWDIVRAPYLREAPSYRAPSGFASSDRLHVERHVAMLSHAFTGAQIPSATAIESLSVESATVDELLERYPTMVPIDVFQVDIEGLDDQIVLSSVKKGFLPHIVNFEVEHLSQRRLHEVRTHLEGFGYETVRRAADLLAIRSRPRPPEFDS